MIVYRRYLLTFAESWFLAPRQVDGAADVVVLRQSPERPECEGAEEFRTLVLDLGDDEETLLGRISGGARYKIRRAADRDALTHDVWDEPRGRALRDFHGFLARFCAQKGLPIVPWSLLERYAEHGALTVSRVAGRDGASLAWHSYVRYGGRARLLHSASLFRGSADTAHRNLVGRANRWHHWRDLLHFKQSGHATYDLGGWYAGDSDNEKLRINRFKEEFGGRQVIEWNAVIARSLAGRAYLAARRVVGAA